MLTIKNFIPGIAWFFLLLVLMCLPGSSFPKTDNFFDKIFFDKWVHAGLFAVLAFLFLLPISKSSLGNKRVIAIKIVVAVCIWGLGIEFIQKYCIPRRSFDLWDWAADSAGALAAYFWFRKKLQKNYTV
jgi:VanZ family protein